MNFAEVTIPITLDKPRKLIFNLNTMSAFEEASNGVFYFDFIMRLYEVYSKALTDARYQAIKNGTPEIPDEQLQLDTRTLVRAISVRDLHAVIWAACHEYHGDEPYWPLTKNQIGRIVKPMDMLAHLPLIMRGHAQNSPTEKEAGESSAAAKLELVSVAETENPSETGGEASGVLVAADLE